MRLKILGLFFVSLVGVLLGEANAGTTATIVIGRFNDPTDNKTTQLYNFYDSRWFYNNKAVVRLVLVGGSGPQIVETIATKKPLKVVVGYTDQGVPILRQLHGKGKKGKYFTKAYTLNGNGTSYLEIPLKANWRSQIKIRVRSEGDNITTWSNFIDWDARNGNAAPKIPMN